MSLKLCTDCVYYRPPDAIWESRPGMAELTGAMCDAKVPDLITGHVTHIQAQLCNMMRYAGICGTEAKLFEPRP